MSKRITAILITCALGTALFCTGCGKSDSGNPIHSKPFEAAIADYLQSKSFGMKIASVERIDQQGDTATVVCKMQEAEGTYALKVTWEFTCRRADGNWQVEGHTAK